MIHQKHFHIRARLLDLRVLFGLQSGLRPKLSPFLAAWDKKRLETFAWGKKLRQWELTGEKAGLLGRVWVRFFSTQEVTICSDTQKVLSSVTTYSCFEKLGLDYRNFSPVSSQLEYNSSPSLMPPFEEDELSLSSFFCGCQVCLSAFLRKPLKSGNLWKEMFSNAWKLQGMAPRISFDCR